MPVFRIDRDVRYVDDRALEDRPGRPMARLGRAGFDAVRRLKGFWGEVVLGDLMDQLTVELIECAGEFIAQPDHAADDRVEDRLRHPSASGR